MFAGTLPDTPAVLENVTLGAMPGPVGAGDWADEPVAIADRPAHP